MTALLRFLYSKLFKLLHGTGIGKIRLIDNIHRFVTTHIHQDFIDYKGMKLFLDKNDSLGLSVGSGFESGEIDIILNLVNSGDVCVDIGAHVGLYTVLLSKKVGIAGHIYAFEPDKDSFKLLEKNVSANNCRNVSLYNLGVSNIDCELPFYIHKNNQGNNRIYNGGTEQNEYLSYYKVKCMTLDSIIRSNQKVDFIKMDIQGAEMLALQGMKSVLTSNKDIIIVSEFWPYGMSLCGSSAKGYIELLRGLGFNMYEFNTNNCNLISVSTDHVLAKYNLKNKSFTNLVFSRNLINRY